MIFFILCMFGNIKIMWVLTNNLWLFAFCYFCMSVTLRLPPRWEEEKHYIVLLKNSKCWKQREEYFVCCDKAGFIIAQCVNLNIPSLLCPDLWRSSPVCIQLASWPVARPCSCHHRMDHPTTPVTASPARRTETRLSPGKKAARIKQW